MIIMAWRVCRGEGEAAWELEKGEKDVEEQVS